MVTNILIEKIKEVYAGEILLSVIDSSYDEGENTNVLTYHFKVGNVRINAEVKILAENIICEFRELQDGNFELVSEVVLT